MTRSVTIVNTSNHRHENVGIAFVDGGGSIVLAPGEYRVCDPDKILQIKYIEQETPVAYRTDDGHQMIVRCDVSWGVIK